MIIHAFGRVTRDPGDILAGPRATAQAMLMRSVQVSARIVMGAVLRIRL
jgi:hypothetical protein